MIKLISIMLGTLLFASCGGIEEVPQPAMGNSETVAVTKEIHVRVLPMQRVGGGSTRSASDKPEADEAITVTYRDAATTRAQDGLMDMTVAESKIHNAYIVQFNGTSPTGTVAWVSGDIKNQLISGSAITCDFVMTAGVKNRVYVVANLTADQIAAIEGNGKVPITLSAFEAPVLMATLIPATGLPMSAMQDIYPSDVFDVFQLKSLLAKLTFTCQTKGATLKLKGVPSSYSFNTQAQPGNEPFRSAGVTYTDKSIASGTPYYVPENLSGSVSLPSPLFRCSTFAPGNSLFVEIAANGTTYNLYLGDGSAGDFNFVGGYAYNVSATISGTNALDLRVGTPDITALDNKGTANCYIVTDPVAKWYSFDGTVMGNGASTPLPAALHALSVASPITPVKLNPDKADVLWETVNTTTTPAVGSIVKSAVYVINGQILFCSGTVEGNAVIAARDARSTIIWSWHIWRTNTDPTVTPQTLASFTAASGTFDATGTATLSGLKILDRSLGALSATAQSDLSAGLLYQWGRKDPFPGAAALSGDIAMASTISTSAIEWPFTAAGGASITPGDAVKKPTTFYTSDGDWTSHNDNLWGTPITSLVGFINNEFPSNSNCGSKSLYDPCPVGWRTPPGYAYANASTSNSGVFNKGYSFSILTSDNSWFPASGARGSLNGALNFFLEEVGVYWVSTPSVIDTPGYGGVMAFESRSVNPIVEINRSFGFSIRCVQGN